MKLKVFAIGLAAAIMAANAAAGNTMLLNHKTVECTSCHDKEHQVSAPNSQSCILCHGEMGKIKLPPNEFKKDAHRSPHYADLVECTTCHSVHKESRSLCLDCHVIK